MSILLSSSSNFARFPAINFLSKSVLINFGLTLTSFKKHLTAQKRLVVKFLTG